MLAAAQNRAQDAEKSARWTMLIHRVRQVQDSTCIIIRCVSSPVGIPRHFLTVRRYRYTAQP